MSGVTLTGFEKKNLEDIKNEIKADLLAINPELNLLDTSVIGQIVGVFSDKLREAWDVLEAVYRAFYPDSASGDALEQLCSLTGIQREVETQGTVTLDQLFLEDGVTVPAGSVVSSGQDGTRWETLTALTNSTGATATLSVEAVCQSYGAVSGNAGAIDTIQTPVVGWSDKAAVSAANTGPYIIDGNTMGIRSDTYDNGYTFQTVGFYGVDPISIVDIVDAINTQTTGITAYNDGLGKPRIESNTSGQGSFIHVIGGSAAPILGFSTDVVKGFNSQDAVLGNNRETDPELRVRRAQALRAPGAATIEAIYAGLITVEDVETVVIFENTLPIVYDGLPPKSFEAMVMGGLDADIADRIWEKKPAGITAYGTTTVVITDSMGFDHDIKFSRPLERDIEIHYTLTVDPDLYPVDGNDQVKAAALDLASSLDIGGDVIALQFRSAALNVAGVIDVPTFTIGFLGGSLGTSNLTIDKRERAIVDSGNITVTV